VHSSGNNFSVELKTDEELSVMRQAGNAVAKILEKLVSCLAPGMSTKDLDDVAVKEISSLGLKAAFLGYNGFPATACISVNDELVHGIPSNKKIVKEGDIVTFDMGVICKGFYGDAAVTAGVGGISEQAKKLIKVTRESLDQAIAVCKPGNRLGDVSWAVQSYAEGLGYSIVRDWTGHGIGRKLHEEPSIPNFGKAHTGIRLVPGMVLAIEPMINVGDWRVKTLDDGWTVVTVDGKLCAHCEHMVAITKDGCEVLTKGSAS
jgi:methionyl aminopeptidase